MGFPNFGQGAAATKVALPPIKTGGMKLPGKKFGMRQSPKMARLALTAGMKGGC